MELGVTINRYCDIYFSITFFWAICLVYSYASTPDSGYWIWGLLGLMVGAYFAMRSLATSFGGFAIDKILIPSYCCPKGLSRELNYLAGRMGLLFVSWLLLLAVISLLSSDSAYN